MSDALAVKVGEIANEMKSLKKRPRSTSRKATKKKPTKKRQTLKKWKLERVASQTNGVFYQKIPKKGYLLVIPKNTVVRDTTENRTKYANVPYTPSRSSVAPATAML